MVNYCMYCGKPVQEDAEFCMYCGKPLPKLQDQVQLRSPSQPQQTAQQMPARSSAVPMTAQQSPAPQAQPSPAASGREILLGELDLADPGTSVSGTSGPLAGIFKGIWSYVKGIFSIFRNRFALTGTALAAALWSALYCFRDSDSKIVKILSILSYADGGFGRDIPGIIGGTIGKGTVLASIASLFTKGGFNSLFKGIGALFTGHGEKRGIAGIVIGTVVGAGVSLFFTGTDTGVSAVMAGISGLIFSLEALGSESGKLFGLAGSLTSRVTEGTRSINRGSCYSLLTGLSIGFALAAALTALGVTEVFR